MKYLCLLSLLLVFACKDQPVQEVETEPEIGLIAENAMVVSAREEASRIGLEVLKSGGNAFDAMVATEMALAVAYPIAGNLGGGGFMVYRTQHGELGTFDFREMAPIKAHRDMYLDEQGEVIADKSLLGGMAIGVPGTVAGIFAVHQKLGTLPIEELLQPAIDLARNGYVLTELDVKNINEQREKILKANGKPSLYTANYKAGDRIVNEALANTLSRIARNGRSEFYSGETARILSADIQAKGGILSMNDLKSYEAEWREPLTFQYKDLKVISMAPPSSGGVCLAQIMKALEPYPIDEYGHNSAKSIQLITEAERRAYADRSHFLGDPDFVDIPVDVLISEEYVQGRMGTMSFEKATPSDAIRYGDVEAARWMQLESTETTHYSIVDQFGNAVANTTTLNAYFGSKVYVDELGFFLNNEMDDFSSKPGQPNMFGLIGGENNAIAPMKRMLSSMTPTVIEKEGELYMVLGTPGGSTIITSVLQTILNVYEFDMNMQQAVNAPRFHHQWLPDAVQLETDEFPDDILLELESKGYTIDEAKYPVIGKVDAIHVLPDGRLEGGADKRGDDTALGY
ncbi:MAG: gamma-glutamyltransferase [Bacteroidota bacterium]